MYLPQTCLLYGGLRGVLDYGVSGCALLENLRAALKHHFTSAPPLGGHWGVPGGPSEGEEEEEVKWEDINEGNNEGQDAATLRDRVFLVETAAIGPLAMWRHSGHLELFHDEAVQCTDTGTVFRQAPYIPLYASLSHFPAYLFAHIASGSGARLYAGINVVNSYFYLVWNSCHLSVYFRRHFTAHLAEHDYYAIPFREQCNTNSIGTKRRRPFSNASACFH